MTDKSFNIISVSEIFFSKSNLENYSGIESINLKLKLSEAEFQMSALSGD